MKKYKYVIIGGGTTAGYAAAEFAEQGIEKGDLCIISAESILPMNRPPLSKEYLKDKNKDDELLINDKKFYEQHGIDVLIETCAQKVKFAEKIIELDNGEALQCEKLLIATGSKVKHPDIPNENLENVFYLRNVKHSDKIREKAKEAKTAVIVGGGYIGTETAAALTEMGVKVTMIVPEDRLLSKFASDDIAAFFKEKFADEGVDVLFGQEASGFYGDEKVEEVELKSGKRFKTDMVIIGVGVEPNVKIFSDSNLNIDTGIVVNEFCETNIPDVYAAGDVVEFPDKIFNKIRHVEHWENAFEQGKHAAKVMTGKIEPYIFLPFFFSDVFDVSYEYFGDNESATDIINRGNLEKGDFSTWWINDNRVVAAFIMSTRPKEEGEKAREWIRNRTQIDKDKLSDENKPLKELELNP
jgi:3-phenylpropionate/trans-cinnamate dioxygenase ferredoxin reductase component